MLPGLYKCKYVLTSLTPSTTPCLGFKNVYINAYAACHLPAIGNQTLPHVGPHSVTLPTVNVNPPRRHITAGTQTDSGAARVPARPRPARRVGCRLVLLFPRPPRGRRVVARPAGPDETRLNYLIFCHWLPPENIITRWHLIFHSAPLRPRPLFR